MTNKLKIANKLRELREKKQYSLNDLAIRTGMKKQNLQSYEVARNGVPLSKLEALVKVYGYSLGDFLKEIEDDRQD